MRDNGRRVKVSVVKKECPEDLEKTLRLVSMTLFNKLEIPGSSKFLPKKRSNIVR